MLPHQPSDQAQEYIARTNNQKNIYSILSINNSYPLTIIVEILSKPPPSLLFSVSSMCCKMLAPRLQQACVCIPKFLLQYFYNPIKLSQPQLNLISS